ncbi:MAG: hypothetical protein EA350_06655 [Gemmatimonadales bacterium]|nr:MAG: hypothetical protein EA350_06655 [Gemmatimonadales bacterium]
MAQDTPTLGIYFEHPDWFRPLFAELDRRGLPWDAIPAAGHSFDPAERTPSHPVVLNRMSPSAWLRDGPSQIFHTTPWLEHLEGLGARVINGSRAWGFEVSKAAQLSLLRKLGLPFPPARAIHDASALPARAAELRFPVVVKPNVGGSGAGVVRFDSPEALAAAVALGGIDLGIDGTGLIQEFIPARDGRIVRVEVLNGRVLYAIRIYSSGDVFNLCPADVCQGVDGAALARAACPADAPVNDLRVEAYTPPESVTRDVERIMAAAGIEVGGVEYLVDDRDGQLCYYDVNALSNFVADGERVLGFDPFARLVDWLEAELRGVA